MLNKTKRDGRVTDSKTRSDVKRMLAAIVERVGYRSAAKYLDWNQSQLHAIITRDDWTQKVIYPEDVALIRLAHDIIMHYGNIRADARDMINVLIEQSHVFVR